MSLEIYLTIVFFLLTLIFSSLFKILGNSKILAAVIAASAFMAFMFVLVYFSQNSLYAPYVKNSKNDVADFFTLETCLQDTNNIRKDATYQKSNTGEQYGKSMYYAYDEFHDDNIISSQIYYLNGKYETFSGTVFLPFESRSVTSPYYSSIFHIYVDDELVYEAPEFLSGQNPEDFSVDVSGCEYLEIKMGGGWYKDDSSDFIPLACLSNAKITKKK